MLIVTQLGKWVLPVYRVPREPSTPRIVLRRKLRRLGAAQLLDGLVALPLDGRNREQLEWLAEDVTDAGGEASIWIVEPSTAAQERAVAGVMARAVAGEYRQIAEQARAALSGDEAPRRRTLARLRRELRRVRARDYFPPPERREAERAVESLAATAEVHP